MLSYLTLPWVLSSPSLSIMAAAAPRVQEVSMPFTQPEIWDLSILGHSWRLPLLDTFIAPLYASFSMSPQRRQVAISPPRPFFWFQSLSDPVYSGWRHEDGMDE